MVCNKWYLQWYEKICLQQTKREDSEDDLHIFMWTMVFTIAKGKVCRYISTCTYIYTFILMHHVHIWFICVLCSTVCEFVICKFWKSSWYVCAYVCMHARMCMHVLCMYCACMYTCIYLCVTCVQYMYCVLGLKWPWIYYPDILILTSYIDIISLIVKLN